MNFKTAHSFSLAPVVLAAVLLAGCGGDKPEAMLASAKDYLAKNDNKAAAIQLKNALQKQPELAEGRYLLGVALLNGGDVAGAEIELRKALELKQSPDDVVPKLVRAMAMQGKTAKAAEEFGKVTLSGSAAKAELQTVLASLYASLGDKAKSQAALDAALAADPDNVSALLMRVREKMAALDIDGAASGVDAVIAKHSKDFDAWKLKGDVLLYGRNQPEEALQAYRKSVELKSDFLAGQNSIVTVLLRQGKIADAEKEVEAMKKFAPAHPQTRLLETQIAYTKKDFKLARESAQQLLKIAPGNPRSLEIAGGIELQLNSLLTAEDYLAKAVLAAPELPLARRWLVMTYLRSGQVAKAQTTLAPMLKDKTTDASLLSLAGEVQLQSGDVKKAEEYFAKASMLDPKDARKRTSLALTRLVDGKVDSAFGELTDIAASDTGTTADMALISAHLRRREFDRALKAIDGLEKKSPSSPLAANLRGRTQMAMNNPAAARKSYEAALAINATYMPAVTGLAALDLSEQKPEDARKRFETVLDKEPKNGAALLALAELRARDGGSKEDVADLIGKAVAANPTEVAPRVLLVDFHLRNKDAKKAISVAQDALAAMPDKPELLDAMGRAQVASGDLNQATTTFTKLVGLLPQSPMPLLRLADAQLMAKNESQAEQSLTKAIELKADYLDAQRRLIGMRMAAGKYPEAAAIARTIQKQRPKEGIGYLLEGDVLLAQKNFAGAAGVYRAGISQVPSPELAVKLHASLIATGKPQDAEKFAAEWAKSQPKDATMPFYLAGAAMARKDYALAEKYYLGIVQLQPANPVAYNNLAWVTARLNKDGAVAYAEKANTLAPNQPAFMDTLAVLLADKQDFKKAIELQTKVLGLQAENPVFKLNMAKIYVKAGEKDSARKQLDDLAKLGDKFGGQKEVAELRATL